MTSAISKPQPPTGYDPFAPALLDDPHTYWQTAEMEKPVFYYEKMDCWVITGWENVNAAVRDNVRFSSNVLAPFPLPSEASGRVSPHALEVSNLIADNILLNIDLPVHTPIRRAFQRALTKPLIESAGPHIRAQANALIDSFIDKGHAEFVADYAHPLSLGTIVELLGLPTDVMPEMRLWIGSFAGLLAPRKIVESGASPVSVEEHVEALTRLEAAVDLFEKFLKDRAETPQDDLASALVSMHTPDGSPAVPYSVLLVNLMGLSAAGGLSTANFMTRMVRYLSQNTRLRDRLIKDPDLWPSVIEEGARRFTGTTHLMRVTTEDVPIGGAVIPAGSSVLLNVPSANGDSCEFAKPLEFQLDRPNASNQLQFGAGRHGCLGAPLVRFEARIAFEELYRRIPDLSVDPDQHIEIHPAVIDGAVAAMDVSWSTVGHK